MTAKIESPEGKSMIHLYCLAKLRRTTLGLAVATSAFILPAQANLDKLYQQENSGAKDIYVEMCREEWKMAQYTKLDLDVTGQKPPYKFPSWKKVYANGTRYLVKDNYFNRLENIGVDGYPMGDSYVMEHCGLAGTLDDTNFFQHSDIRHNAVLARFGPQICTSKGVYIAHFKKHYNDDPIFRGTSGTYMSESAYDYRTCTKTMYKIEGNYIMMYSLNSSGSVSKSIIAIKRKGH